MAKLSESATPDILYTETANASITTPASGNQKLFVDTDHILKYKNSSGTVSNVGAGGSGTVTTVKDEGSNLSTAVVSLDFVGAGVTATGTTAVTVTIPGGGSTDAL